MNQACHCPLRQCRHHIVMCGTKTRTWLAHKAHEKEESVGKVFIVNCFKWTQKTSCMENKILRVYKKIKEQTIEWRHSDQVRCPLLSATVPWTWRSFQISEESPSSVVLAATKPGHRLTPVTALSTQCFFSSFLSFFPNSYNRQQLSDHTSDEWVGCSHDQCCSSDRPKANLHL